MISAPLGAVAEMIRGAVELEHVGDGLAPRRLPAWTRQQQADRWIELWSAQTVGVHLVTVTAASSIRLVLSVTQMIPPDRQSPPFDCSVVATIAGEPVARASIGDGPVVLWKADRTWQEVDGPLSHITLELPAATEAREVHVWLPHNAATVIHEIQSDAPLNPAIASRRSRWVHHGSSVSHCLEASDPLSPWPQIVARSLGVDLTNLAIAGNAQLDPFVARTLAAQPADVISLKLGVNIVNGDTMRRRAFVPALHGFLDLVRQGHPSTPIVVLGPIACPAIEHTPGPTRKLADGFYQGTPREVLEGDGTLTLSLVRDLVREAVQTRAQSDGLLWGDDGLALFSADDAPLLWDGLHPNQAGYDLIAARFTARADDPGTGVGAAFSHLA